MTDEALLRALEEREADQYGRIHLSSVASWRLQKLATNWPDHWAWYVEGPNKLSADADTMRFRIQRVRQDIVDRVKVRLTS